jgi:hypothetical protein
LLLVGYFCGRVASIPVTSVVLIRSRKKALSL